MKQHNYESGQSIVLVALAMIALLGFLGLAIDGGRLYTETRQAQNAADGAAMAAALALCNNETDPSPLETGKNAAALVGYDDNGIDNTVAIAVDYTKEQVEVTIWSEIPATIAEIVYSGGLQTSVRAVSKCFSGSVPSPLAGVPFGIITLGTTCSADKEDSSLASTGGGGRGGIKTYGSHMFVNVPDDPDPPGSHCAISGPTSNENLGIEADGDYCIYTVGSATDFPGNVDDCIIPNFNEGTPIGDPLAQAPAPICTQEGQDIEPASGYDYAPGNWVGSQLGGGRYQPGIYCISGPMYVGGSNVVDARDGVVFYLEDSPLTFEGNSNLHLNAPTGSTCTGSTSGEPTASCTFKGMAIYMARDNASTVGLAGNGEFRIRGTIYGVNGIVHASGGGKTGEDKVVVGQVIVARILNNGNGDLNVWYDPDVSYYLPPTLGLVE
jgi:hypothetical protein